MKSSSTSVTPTFKNYRFCKTSRSMYWIKLQKTGLQQSDIKDRLHKDRWVNFLSLFNPLKAVLFVISLLVFSTMVVLPTYSWKRTQIEFSKVGKCKYIICKDLLLFTWLLSQGESCQPGQIWKNLNHSVDGTFTHLAVTWINWKWY